MSPVSVSVITVLENMVKTEEGLNFTQTAYIKLNLDKKLHQYYMFFVLLSH